ncbi:MAG: hypothetical protein LBM63_04595 [Rikenellaceae bacterium]|nr:hypothetical protein [Rikenellaceae bacterium]
MEVTLEQQIPELLERARAHYRAGRFGAAANDFGAVVALDPANDEALGYLFMIDEIQNFRNTDLLNP